MMGAVAVAALFLLLLRRAGLFAALVVSLAALATPLLAVHAHYLKEDVWLLPFCVFTTITFGRLAERPRPSLVILLGIWVGLAVSSKAIGVFLIPVLFATAFL
jgi:4-amino-4-deoxy-L-arabinose transferase-like glycosyltransferase